MQAFRKIGQLNNPKNFPVWLFQIAKRTLSNTIRDEQRHNIIGEEGDSDQSALIPDQRELPETIIEGHERSAIVNDCLRQMPESQRVLLSLRYGAGLNAPEIASILELKPGTVRHQLVTSRRALKALIQKHPQGAKEFMPGIIGPWTLPLLISEVLKRQFPLEQPMTAASTVDEGFFARLFPAGQIMVSQAANSTSVLTDMPNLAKVGVCALALVMTVGAGGSSRQLGPADIVTNKHPDVSTRTAQEVTTEHDNDPAVVQTPVGIQQDLSPAPPGEDAPVARTPEPRPVTIVPPQPTPAPEPVLPVITLANQHVHTTVGGVLSAAQLLTSSGAQATDNAGRGLAVRIIDYRTDVFSTPGSYVFSVVARDANGVKAKSATIIVDVG